MLEMFKYDFMVNAFIVGILIAAIIPCIGTVVVLRRLSIMGDALSHISLAGVAAGLVFGINPILSAVVFAVIASLCIEKIRSAIPKYGEISTAVIMSFGIGLAAILSGFVTSGNFNSFLFGSLMAINPFEKYLIIGLSVVVLAMFLLLYRALFYVTFDEESARLAGIPVKLVTVIFTVLTAVTISISSRVVGTLVVSSMMVLPVAVSMQIAKSYKKTVVFSVLFSVFFVVTGLFLSYYLDLKPGGTIVMTGVLTLVATLLVKSFKERIKRAVKIRGED
ncbi:zinc ABC transporter permease protein AdcB [Thermoclostridium stercorarium subsp. stercorarium DSM 8532]|jgi:zinc transport system permease protein|uniref:Zinc ABC transporter permease protein AdcB n=3 Tax=Thermoclostridium stercorarium TaxID=1510 RepID=L7VSE9_THES1|nr:metal ABC transporter permease [Thermoclostridium stercorarium]AGC69554.1 zinc ABC transporter permease protein AdcB [Thermoclostridium stercorarium subsp. stercorarium DSM 8532]AGI40506.1 ABC transporter permease subunit [Thermoclostridium stercorarium subsp. stercorarium DSM 8532]ANW99786.1 metal ABC transporter permease [Thermoclostridium stercorarium subsp. thermolacticum DSM 2910]ANX02413.1 metal ABC transporter permease [Thermoclostridium stercorarium subsp. leptospartum DSM 9219]UZQ8